MDESCGSLGVCRWRGRLGHGAPEPAYQLDPGGPEHPRLRQGLRGSGARCLDFRLGRPPPAAAAMRALMRARKQLVREGASHVQRLQKVLEDANLKLASVLSDIVGVSGRAILEALIAGEADPDRLLALVHRRVKAEPGRLRAALTGRLTDHHRFLLRLHLRQTDAIDAALAEIDAGSKHCFERARPRSVS